MDLKPFMIVEVLLLLLVSGIKSAGCLLRYLNEDVI